MTHTIRWIHHEEIVRAQVTCSDVEDRIESVCTVSAQCDCEAFSIEHDERGYFHTVIEHDDEDALTEVRHDMPHNPDEAECNYLLFVDGQWEELYDGGDGGEVLNGPIEFAWQGDYYTWRYAR